MDGPLHLKGTTLLCSPLVMKWLPSCDLKITEKHSLKMIYTSGNPIWNSFHVRGDKIQWERRAWVTPSNIIGKCNSITEKWERNNLVSRSNCKYPSS